MGMFSSLPLSPSPSLIPIPILTVQGHRQHRGGHLVRSFGGLVLGSRVVLLCFLFFFGVELFFFVEGVVVVVRPPAMVVVNKIRMPNQKLAPHLPRLDSTPIAMQRVHTILLSILLEREKRTKKSTAEKPRAFSAPFFEGLRNDGQRMLFPFFRPVLFLTRSLCFPIFLSPQKPSLAQKSNSTHLLFDQTDPYAKVGGTRKKEEERAVAGF